jgi:hypothetical protein
MPRSMTSKERLLAAIRHQSGLVPSSAYSRLAQGHRRLACWLHPGCCGLILTSFICPAPPTIGELRAADGPTIAHQLDVDASRPIRDQRTVHTPPVL